MTKMITNLTNSADASSEALNDTLREHEATVDWDHRKIAADCYKFFDVFNAEFFDGKLPNCFLQFDKTRVNNLGHYRPGRNVVGARHEINLNARYVGGPLQDVLATLLHEMAHEYQELFGKPGRGAFHNKEFVALCAGLGIPCTGGMRSYTLGYTDRFVNLLLQNDVAAAVTVVAAGPAPRRVGTSKMKLWQCQCGTKIRAAVVVQARCLRCETLFVRQEA